MKHTSDLLFETLRLRSESDPDDLARDWSEARPDGLYALADYERAAMWIHRRMSEIEAEAAAPSGFTVPLRRHSREAAARNELVDAEAAEIVTWLTALGIPSVLLRGMARRIAGAAFPCGDARSTNDVDLLLRAEDADAAWEGLIERGYKAKDSMAPRGPALGRGPAQGRPLQPLTGPGHVSVDLHVAMSRTMTPEEAWHRANDDARDIEWNGVTARIPNPTELLWHGITHALNSGTRAWRLRFFLDAACILAGDEPVTWQIIGQRLDAGEVASAPLARRWLHAASQLAGVEIPRGIRDGVPRFDVRKALRWRLNVLRDRENSGFGGRLLEEGTRRELGIGVAPRAPGSSLYRRTRRRLGGLAARVVYGVWRATGSRSMRI